MALIGQWILDWIPLLVTSSLALSILYGLNWILLKRNPELSVEKRFPRQVTLVVLTMVAVIASIIALPVPDSLRNQLLALFSLVVSGVIAFSSTTLVANLMAGIMLRVTRSFKVGEFIQVGEYFGRVVERALLDTEIQTEHRQLISLPNTYLITHPVSAIHASGTVVSTSLSLGYDIHHRRIEPVLRKAAEQTGLDDAYVQILSLGDYSVVYRVAGMLQDVKRILTVRSELNRAVLDALHQADIEIVSPTFMNQRPLDPGHSVIPPPYDDASEQPPDTPVESVVFDKAEKAERLEKERDAVRIELETLEQRLKSAHEEERAILNQAIEQVREQQKRLEKPIDEE